MLSNGLLFISMMVIGAIASYALFKRIEYKADKARRELLSAMDNTYHLIESALLLNHGIGDIARGRMLNKALELVGNSTYEIHSLLAEVNVYKLMINWKQLKSGTALFHRIDIHVNEIIDELHAIAKHEYTQAIADQTDAFNAVEVVNQRIIDSWLHQKKIEDGRVFN